MFKVTGRVYLQETGTGLPGLHVKAVDKDFLFDDVLGTTTTDADGRFEITYEREDFRELFEKTPDLYVVVRDPRSRRILFSSEDGVRSDAGASETVDIPLSQAVIGGSGGPDDPDGPRQGTAKVRLNAVAALPDEVKLFFTEHRSDNRRQHKFVVRGEKEIAVELPAGEYTMQILAKGYETVSGLAQIERDRPFAFEATLTPRQRKSPSTFEERLKRYGIDARQATLAELDVPARTTVSLDYRHDRENASFRMLQADSIDRLKEWIGSDDRRFGHESPVYGPLPEPWRLAKLAEPGRGAQSYAPDEVQAVTALAREYVQGNSRSVQSYRETLDNMIRLTSRDVFKHVPLYFFRVVTIGAGATLEIGSGSAVFTCDELRIHKTGTLKPVGSVKIEIGTWTEFQ
jgi:hypothetical protein